MLPTLAAAREMGMSPNAVSIASTDVSPIHDGIESALAHGIDVVVARADDAVQWAHTRELLRLVPTRAVLVHSSNAVSCTEALATLDSEFGASDADFSRRNEWLPAVGVGEIAPVHLRYNRRFYEQNEDRRGRRFGRDR